MKRIISTLVLSIYVSLRLFSQVSNCGAAVDGYAAVSGDGYTQTTGGTGGTVVTVSTEAELTAWVSSREKNTTAEILFINGKIEAATSTVLTIKNGANISIIGKNVGELKNIGLNIRNYYNVIVANLIVHEVLYPNDCITLDNVNHGWVNHCELYSTIGPGVTYDTYDGMLDVKNGSKYITISWNRIHDHMKTMLYGHTDNVNSQATDSTIQVTLHHNFLYNTDGRNPSLRWGTVHSYNNYFKGVSDYGAAVRRYARMKIENNVYVNVNTPITTDNFIVDTGDDGIVCERGSSFTNCGANSITKTDCNWWNYKVLPYSYTLTPTASVAALVETNAGLCGITYAAIPSIQIVSPVTGDVFAPGASVIINATATIASGTISKVEFYHKKEDAFTLIGTATSSPYTTTWSKPANGTYNLIAMVYDASGKFYFSNTAIITVGGTSTVPTLTTPVNNSQILVAGTAIQSIVFAWGGSATDVTITNLPAGLTYTKDAAAKTITITGTPTASGTYTVSTAGGTSTVSVTGTITVNPATVITQSIYLVKGWNLVSTNVCPVDSSIASLFSGLDVLEIKTMDSFWGKSQLEAFNSLKHMGSGRGYLVKMNAAGTLRLDGVPVETQDFASLQQNGWQLIGCPFQTPTAISDYFSAANCSQIKNFEAFWSSTGTGTLTNFEPGRGYYVKGN